MEDELKKLQELTANIPQYRAEYDRMIAERNERDEALKRYVSHIKSLEESNTINNNIIKELRLEIKKTADKQINQPIASTSAQSAKRQNTDMHFNDNDNDVETINIRDVEQHITNTIGNRFTKIEDSQRQMADAMEQIRAALITNSPTITLPQFPRLQRSTTPAPAGRARSLSRKSVQLPDNKPKTVKMFYAAPNQQYDLTLYVTSTSLERLKKLKLFFKICVKVLQLKVQGLRRSNLRVRPI